jgi:hypothetical protein
MTKLHELTHDPRILVNAARRHSHRYHRHGLWRGGRHLFRSHFHPALRLPPEVAIGVGLITEVFGFASGLFALRPQTAD